MEKTYFEIKVTFVHILIMLGAVILIGILLFYMGYKAGFRANPSAAGAPAAETKEELAATPLPVDEKPLYNQPAKTAATPTVESESKLYTPPAGDAKSAKAAPPADQYAIRVGAFSSQENARNYASRFQRAGYRVKVVAPEPGAKAVLFLVLVGQYSDMAVAKAEKEKLEKLENKKFIVVSSR